MCCCLIPLSSTNTPSCRTSTGIITCITAPKNVSARKYKALRSPSHVISASRGMESVILVSLNSAARAPSTPAALIALRCLTWDLHPSTGPLCQALHFSSGSSFQGFFELYHTHVVLESVLFLTCLLTVLTGSQLCIMLFTHCLITSLLASPGCWQWICSPRSGTQVVNKFGFR